MKVNVGINQKIGQPNYGSFGVVVNFELDVEQSMLSRPDEMLSHIKYAADLAHAAVDRELEQQRRRIDLESIVEEQAEPREPGCDDLGLEPANGRSYGGRLNGHERLPARREPEPRRDDRRRDDDRGRRRPADDDSDPVTGPQLFGWAKDRDLLKWFDSYGKRNRFPRKFNDWAERDVADAMSDYYASASQSNGASRNGRH